MYKLFGKIVAVGLLMVGVLQAQTEEITIYKGWNLISAPVDETVSDFSRFGDYYAIWVYDNDKGMYEKNPSSINYKLGYWLYSYEDAKTVSFEGEAYNPESDFDGLAEGWHLLGTGEKLQGIHNTYHFKSVYAWSGKNAEWTKNPAYIMPGQGFFVKKDSAYTSSSDSESTIEVETISNDTELNTSINISNAVETNTSTYTVTEVNETVLTVSKDYDDAMEDIDKNLFVDGMFRGVVDTVADNGDGTVTYSMREAESFEEVFDSFSLQMTNDEIIRTLKRSLPAHIGKYDYLNAEPLSYSFHERMVTDRSTGRKTKQITMRLEFPEGYYIPVEPRGVDFDVDCSVWDADCRVTAEASQNISLDASVTKYGITIGTKGSYIEFGIGAYVYTNYDCNRAHWYSVSCDSQYEFEYGGDAYFESELIFGVQGELTKKWTTTLNVLDPIAVTIVPATATYGVAQVNIAFDPQLELGVSGTIEGEAVARAYVKRQGEVGFKYSTEDGNPQKWDKTETSSYEKTNEAGIGIEAKLEAQAWVYPYLETYPELKFFMVAPSITMVKLRTGAKADAELNGEFSAGMEIVNSEFNSYLNAGICASLNLIPSIDYKFQFKFGSTNVYPSSDVDYSTIYSKTYQILEWCMELLNTPEIQSAVGDNGYTWVNFDIEADDDAKEHMHYVYTLDGSDPSSSNGTTWDGVPFILQETSTVKVYAYLENKDVSDSYWAFGTSYSLIAETTVEATNPIDDDELQSTAVEG